MEELLDGLRALTLRVCPGTRAVHDDRWPTTKAQWELHLERLARRKDPTWSVEHMKETVHWLLNSDHRDAVFWALNVRSPRGLEKHHARVHPLVGGGEIVSLDDDWA